MSFPGGPRHSGEGQQLCEPPLASHCPELYSGLQVALASPGSKGELSVAFCRLAQSRQQQQNVEDAVKEMQKPLARYIDDQDLDQMLREQEREGDPMANFIKKRKSKEGKDQKGLHLAGAYWAGGRVETSCAWVLLLGLMGQRLLSVLYRSPGLERCKQFYCCNCLYEV